MFLLEGPQAVAEALTFRPQLVVELYATPTALERYTDIAQTAIDAGVDVEFVSEEVLHAMADTVAAGLRRRVPPVPDRGEGRLRREAQARRHPRGGARSRQRGHHRQAADAAGADAVVFTGRAVDLYNPKVVRSSTGSIFHLPVAVGAELEDVLRRARAAGLTVLAADVKGEDLLDARSDGVLARPTAWLFGNEAQGLPDEQLASPIGWSPCRSTGTPNR